LELLAKDLGLSGKIFFHGGCAASSVREHFNRSDIFVLPSIIGSDNSQEGQPVSLIEAQATGLPAISTFTGGIAETMLDGKSGFLVKEKDPESLAERLQFLIDNPKVCEPMGQAGRQFVEEEFSLNQCAAVISSIYERVLSEG